MRRRDHELMRTAVVLPGGADLDRHGTRRSAMENEPPLRIGFDFRTRFEQERL